MAGDWIKVESSTPDKPEVVQMAQQLEMDQDAVFGKLMRLWIWADQQTLTGNARGVTKTWIDRYTYCAGFADAMQAAGWLIEENGEIAFPNFERHNGQTAKSRALTAKRVQKLRNAPSVTSALPEKRREEKSIRNNTTTIRPTVEEIAAYCQERNNGIDPQSFYDYYSANGWKVGRQTMKDWRAAIRTWERNQKERKQPSQQLSRAEQRQAEMLEQERRMLRR